MKLYIAISLLFMVITNVLALFMMWLFDLFEHSEKILGFTNFTLLFVILERWDLDRK
jgi:hypothetical protein